jgi:hypothetical protein
LPEYTDVMTEYGEVTKACVLGLPSARYYYNNQSNTDG